jgi:serine/threonine protein kinase
LADFGLAKEGIGDDNWAKTFCGSPAYLSPEVLNSKGASKMSDIYGIGATMFEMLTGEPPFFNEDIPYMYR